MDTRCDNDNIYHYTINFLIKLTVFMLYCMQFCSVIGEIVADLALTGTTSHDISLFSLENNPSREGWVNLNGAMADMSHST